MRSVKSDIGSADFTAQCLLALMHSEDLHVTHTKHYRENFIIKVYFRICVQYIFFVMRAAILVFIITNFADIKRHVIRELVLPRAR